MAWYLSAEALEVALPVTFAGEAVTDTMRTDGIKKNRQAVTVSPST